MRVTTAWLPRVRAVDTLRRKLTDVLNQVAILECECMFETGDEGGRVDVLLFIFSKGVLLYHEQHRFWAVVGHKCMGPLTADVLCSNIVLCCIQSDLRQRHGRM